MNLLIRDSFLPQAWDFPSPALLVQGRVPSVLGGLLLLVWLELDLLLSMKHKGFFEAWQLVLVKGFILSTCTEVKF